MAPVPYCSLFGKALTIIVHLALSALLIVMLYLADLGYGFFGLQMCATHSW